MHHYRAYALVSFAELLQASLRHWHYGRSAEALRILRNALDIDARILDDPQLATERALADRLLSTMHAQEPAAVHAGLRPASRSP